MRIVPRKTVVKPILKKQIQDPRFRKKINHKYLDLGYLKYLNSTKSKIEVDE